MFASGGVGRLDRDSIRRILAVRLSAVGDVINTLPAVTALRSSFPGAWIAFAVEDKAKDVVIGHPDINEVIVFPRKRWGKGLWNPLKLVRTLGELTRYLREIQEKKFDVVLDFQGNLKGALHSWFSGVPVRIGFAKGHCEELNHWFSTIRVAPASERINRVEKFLALLHPLGVPPTVGKYRLPPSPESRESVTRFLESIGGGPYVLIHPGTSLFGKAKRWPLDRFADLANRIVEALRFKVVVAWGPGERPMAEAIVKNSKAMMAMETRSLLELAELLRRATLFIGADSGPLHLASAVGVPSVALFGPKDPAVYGPFNPRHRVVYRPNGNGLGSMQAITVEDAFQAAVSLL
jgi:lipopolysaccharide heptosyltransferase I